MDFSVCNNSSGSFFSVSFPQKTHWWLGLQLFHRCFGIICPGRFFPNSNHHQVGRKHSGRPQEMSPLRNRQTQSIKRGKQSSWWMPNLFHQQDTLHTFLKLLNKCGQEEDLVLLAKESTPLLLGEKKKAKFRHPIKHVHLGSNMSEMG